MRCSDTEVPLYTYNLPCMHTYSLCCWSSITFVHEISSRLNDCRQRSNFHDIFAAWILLSTSALVVGLLWCMQLGSTVEPWFTVTSLVRSPFQYVHPCSVPDYFPQCKYRRGDLTSEVTIIDTVLLNYTVYY